MAAMLAATPINGGHYFIDRYRRRSSIAVVRDRRGAAEPDMLIARREAGLALPAPLGGAMSAEPLDAAVPAE